MLAVSCPITSRRHPKQMNEWFDQDAPARGVRQRPPAIGSTWCVEGNATNAFVTVATASTTITRSEAILPWVKLSAGIDSSKSMNFPIAKSSVWDTVPMDSWCVSAVLVSLAVWIQNQKQKNMMPLISLISARGARQAPEPPRARQSQSEFSVPSPFLK